MPAVHRLLVFASKANSSFFFFRVKIKFLKSVSYYSLWVNAGMAEWSNAPDSRSNLDEISGALAATQVRNSAPHSYFTGEYDGHYFY